jgi:hypothetical protein
MYRRYREGRGSMKERTTKAPDKAFDYVGTRELRQNLASILDSVVREYRVVYAGNKVTGSPAAAILPAEVMPELLGSFRFAPDAQYDAETDQYFIIVREINADGIGDTPEDTGEVLLDNVEAHIEEFFARASVYMRYEEYRKMYPYYLKLSLAPDRKQLAEVLGLDTLTWAGSRDANL